MIEFKGALPAGALLPPATETAARRTPAHPQVQSPVTMFDCVAKPRALNSKGRVAALSAGNGVQAVATESNSAGTLHADGLGLHFEARRNAGFVIERALGNAARASIALLYSRAAVARVATLLGISLHKSKRWAALVDQGTGFGVDEKKIEGPLELDDSQEPALRLLELEFSGHSLRARLNGGALASYTIQTEGWDGPADLFIGARNHSAGPVGRLGEFILHGLWIAEDVLAISEPVQDWGNALQRAKAALTEGEADGL